MHIRNSLPESIKVRFSAALGRVARFIGAEQVLRVEERLSALGNVILCNDYVALCHPELDKGELLWAAARVSDQALPQRRSRSSPTFWAWKCFVRSVVCPLFSRPSPSHCFGGNTKTIAGNTLVGSYAALSNKGCLVSVVRLFVCFLWF